MEADGSAYLTKDALGNINQTYFDAARNVIKTVDGRGFATLYLFNADNEQTAATDPNGHTTKTQFDAAREVTASYDAAGNPPTTFGYDLAGNQNLVTDPDGNKWRTVFDPTGNAVQTIDANGNTTVTTFDGVDRAIAVQRPLGAADGSTYDKAGNLLSSTTQGITTQFLYNADNEEIAAIDAKGGATSQVYGPRGEVLASFDQNGNGEFFTYNKDDQEISSALATGAVTSLTLDPTGQLLAQKDADGNIDSFQRDKDGNVVATVDPLGNKASATYNADNQLASSTNADGIKTLYTYDPADQLTAKSYIAANGAQTDAESYTYNQDGMQTAASNSYGGYNFTYDNAERLTQQSGLFGLTLNYTNDPNGNVTQVADSAGGTLTSVYDANNRLQSRSFSESGAALRIELTYNAQSEITDEKRYNAATGGTLVGETTQSFDPVGGVTAITHKDGNGNTLQSYTYNYDGAERLTSETDNGGSPISYTYDGANQLINAGGTGYNYDPEGNRNTGSNTVGPDNQLTADANWTYKYDPLGNLVEKDGKTGTQYAGIVWKYGYDAPTD
jgi:YD repeat-containing protein